MTDITKDVSTLTTISEKTLDKLAKKYIYCICEAVQEDIAEHPDEEISILDIGIGTLYIKHIADVIKYHFEPSDALAKNLKATIVDKQCPLADLLSESLATKFLEVYKDLCI